MVCVPTIPDVIRGGDGACERSRWKPRARISRLRCVVVVGYLFGNDHVDQMKRPKVTTCDRCGLHMFYERNALAVATGFALAAKLPVAIWCEVCFGKR